MPSLPRDRRNPEDIDTKSEDHAADALRYLMMYAYKASKPKVQTNKDHKLGANVIGSLKRKKRNKRYAA
jgi:hypothetical protein